jgi:hypothetical protein
VLHTKSEEWTDLTRSKVTKLYVASAYVTKFSLKRSMSCFCVNCRFCGIWHRVWYYEFAYTSQERATPILCLYMKVARSCQARVGCYQTTRCHISELQNLVCTFTLRHQMEAKSRRKDITKYVLRKCDKVQTTEISPKQVRGD